MSLFTLCLLGSPAIAQEVTEANASAKAIPQSPLALGLRYGVLKLPHSSLNPWFHDSDDPIMLGLERPDARGFVVGLEVSPNGLASGVRGYIEYAGIHLDPGYWDAKDTDKSSL